MKVSFLSLLDPINRAGFMDMGPAQLHRDLCSEGPALDLMLCCHHLEMLNNSLTRGPAFSFCTGPHKLCNQSCP